MLNIVLSYWNMASYCNVDDFSFLFFLFFFFFFSCFFFFVVYVVFPTVSMICSDVSPMSMICLVVNSIESDSASVGTERARKV